MTFLTKTDAIQVSENCLMELWENPLGIPSWIAERYFLIDSVTRTECGTIYRRIGKDCWRHGRVLHRKFATQQEVLEWAAFTHGVL